MKRIIKVLAVAFLTVGFFGACNSFGEQQKLKKEVESGKEVEPIQESTEKLSYDYQVGDHLPNELVCMVNNAYMGKPQIPVPVNGKTYYGCCEMCVGALNGDEKARMATDPFSGKQVDKSEAFIVLQNEAGEVAYFESESNYKTYNKKE
ncbi:hypothetical protein JM83_1835 [Gillisia sp. Hel_I_86]|uniref:hypothetical protein n=1 Tax=Gillisia sp. Hel_I_86 TaxID=1249981 RepID=UPI00119A96DC|nr:hypothetical protein [Gillisia sp. Hel_I_86]TVZ26844.1 hypothetical protein JM83_1835 [Gillisia sp. Hel_I_86]